VSFLADSLEHLVRGIVDNPDEVRVDLITTRRGRTVLVPFVQAIVPVVDVRGGRVVLDPPEGLLDDAG
jgi:ribosomal 30S subunit maturation factor RimM